MNAVAKEMSAELMKSEIRNRRIKNGFSVLTINVLDLGGRMR